MSSVLNIGVSSFVAAFHQKEDCEINGLPRLPNSVNIIGRVQYLKSLQHPHLAAYLDVRRNKHERVIVVSEHYSTTVETLLQETVNDEYLRDLMYECLCALDFLHHHHIVHRNLNPRNMLICEDKTLKLSHFGLYYMTNGGKEVSFPIGHPKYSAPEVLHDWHKSSGTSNEQSPKKGNSICNYASDIWSFGIVFLELIIGKPLFSELTVKEIIIKILTCVKLGRSIFNELDIDSLISEMSYNSQQAISLLRDCLQWDCSSRPSANDLLQNPFFSQHKSIPKTRMDDLIDLETKQSEVNDLNMDFNISVRQEDILQSKTHLLQRSSQEVYYYWSLAGGDLEALLREEYFVRHIPPILKMPHFITQDGQPFVPENRSFSFPIYDDVVIPLPADRLFQRLLKVSPTIFYPLLENIETIQLSEDDDASDQFIRRKKTMYDQSIVKQPFSVKERDIEYQIRRIVLFDRLLRAYPYKIIQLRKEALLDIPPFLRGQIWAGLLGVLGNIKQEFYNIDLSSLDEKSLNQINVDLPRCHSYDELLASSTGQEKMRRVLKAWLILHPQYEYTQGMDSLCAIFVRLNFNNEPLALASFQSFIDKYMYNIFSCGTEPLHEYYAVVQQLISFHIPKLSTFLVNMNISLTGFTASWIYTVFAHTFPVHKTMQLWDSLLLGVSSFPMFIFLAIIYQLNLQFNFFNMSAEDVFMFFSNFPEINIDNCCKDAIDFSRVTPPSLSTRSYDNPLYISKHELGIRPLTLKELNHSLAPRISAEDLLQILDYKINPMRFPDKDFLKDIPNLLLIDIRNKEDYNTGCLPGSLNLPLSSAFNANGQLVFTSGVAQTLKRAKYDIKIIINARDDDDAVKFCDQLVQLGIYRVCILQGGVEILKRTDRLFVS